MSSANLWLWIGFNIFVLAMLGLDLGIFHRKAHSISIREAFIWSIAWISLALIFNAGIYIFSGPELALQFFTGYLIEKSLSVDNIFVFTLLFTSLHVSVAYQHRVLFWGILGALVMRGSMIALGVVLLEKFHWITYLFGVFLLLTGMRMAVGKEVKVDPAKNRLLKFARRVLPLTDDYEKDRFFVRRSGKVLATPLFLALLVVEATDIVFALDSIPAIFAITADPFIVYTSNVFAMLGLRSLYFVFANMMGKFTYLQVGLAGILLFTGIKMLLAEIYHISAAVSLLIVAMTLAASVLASVIHTHKRAR